MSSNFDAIHDIVKQQTSDFKVWYTGVARQALINEYRHLPDKVDAIKQKLDETYSKSREITRTYTNEYGGIISMKLFNEAAPKLRPLWKARDKYQTEIERCKRQIALGEDTFVCNELEKLLRVFDSKVEGLARRLDKKSFSPYNLSFSDIGNDPKLFDVIIASDDKKVHARSVLAAFNSECMVAHFRFIITNAR